jgi:hypothetical protein
MEEKGKYDYLYKIFFACLMVSFFIIWNNYYEKEEKSLIENKILTYGTVLYTSRIPRSSGTSFWIEYEFRINDSLFQNKSTLNVDYDHVNLVHDILFLKNLPLIYDKTNIENNQMLFLKDDYIRFGLVRPDTLGDIFTKLDSLSALNKQ